MGKILHVHLTPRASSNKIGSWTKGLNDEDVLRVYVTAIPEDGKANDALIKLLSKYFNVQKSSKAQKSAKN